MTGLAAPAEKVWAGAVDPDGINHELGPWVSMTMPNGIEPGTSIDKAALRVPLGRSWIKVARIPVDFDELCLVERGPGFRFLERSQLGSARTWEHEREIVATGDDSCRLRDRVAIELRSPLRAIGGARLAPPIIRVLFTHRHKRLGERWGVVSAS